MIDAAVIKDALSVLTPINLAIKNIRLYPASSSIVEQSMRRAFEAFETVFSRIDTLTFSESQKDMIICGQLVSRRDQEHIQIKSFLDLMRFHNIKSITFSDGLVLDELKAFFNLVTQTPDAISDEDGLSTLLAASPIPHIEIVPKSISGHETVIEVVDRHRVQHSFSRLREPADLSMPADSSTEQFETDLNRILDGDAAGLTDKRVMKSLPEIINALIEEDETKRAEKLLERLGDELLVEDTGIRLAVVRIMAIICEQLQSKGRTDIFLKLSHRLIRWIRFETEHTPAYDQICLRLQKLIRHMLEQNNLFEAYRLLDVFGRIRSGRLAKPKPIFQTASTVVQQCRSEHIITVLMKNIHASENAQAENTRYSTNVLLIIGVDVLFDRLRKSEDMKERALVLNTLSKMDERVLPEVIRRIEEGGSWYYMRNLVKLLSTIGDPSHLSLLRRLYHQVNFQVQAEILNTIYAIGKGNRCQALIALLPHADERQQKKLIPMLGVLQCSQAVHPLIDILQSREKGSAKNKLAIDKEVCIALGRIGAEEAIPALSPLVQSKGFFRTHKQNELRDIAAGAIAMIRKNTRQKHPQPPAGDPPPLAPDAPEATTAPIQAKDLTMTDLTAREERIDALSQDGNIDDAIKETLELILHYARYKNFAKAEALREKMFDIDPMALTEIVRAAEIIETEKQGSISKDHLDIWPRLYQTLTSEETNALYYAMNEAVFEANKTILNQGDMNSRLFFIDHGKAKVVFRKHDKETLIRTLSAGDVFGEDTFFPISICTTSIIAVETVKLHTLERDTLGTWKDTLPGLAPKIQDYCFKLKKIQEDIEEKGVNRRAHKRYPMNGEVRLQIITKGGETIGRPFKGELSDISASGISLLIKTGRQEAARMLLGRLMKLKISVKGISGNGPKIGLSATVIAVRYHLLNDYSLHLRFEKAIPPDIMNKLIPLSAPGAPK
ncbi:MAG: hypothetical protein CSA22_02140 [Deltaproteobacteria bacterium]|nr:MAG: hypothetical protein CSA22_02140 [Deltaproteobacteria bacterium]